MSAVTPTGSGFADRIPEKALDAAVGVGTSRAAAQNQTLGNIRTRTAALLPTAAISVTFASSVGLLGKDATNGPLHLPPIISGALLVLVVAIGAITVRVQWPTEWDFDSGTNVYIDRPDRESALRAAIDQLEGVVQQNSRRLKRLFLWFELGVVLLAVETVLVIVGLITATT